MKLFHIVALSHGIVSSCRAQKRYVPRSLHVLSQLLGSKLFCRHAEDTPYTTKAIVCLSVSQARRYTAQIKLVQYSPPLFELEIRFGARKANRFDISIYSTKLYESNSNSRGLSKWIYEVSLPDVVKGKSCTHTVRHNHARLLAPHHICCSLAVKYSKITRRVARGSLA